MIPHRSMLFAFLADEALAKAPRAVGVVLILMTDGYRKFKTSKRPIDWEKVSGLSGYGKTTCVQAFDHLIDVGWLEPLDNGGFRITPAKVEAADQRHQEHNARLREARDAQQNEIPRSVETG